MKNYVSKNHKLSRPPKGMSKDEKLKTKTSSSMSTVQTVNVSDMIRPFNGEGDVAAWIKKVKLVTKLKKIPDLASFLPLYLEGDALALYMELDEGEQADAAVVEQKLLEAFSDSGFVAFAKLTHKRWTGEHVDVYANELRRLGGLAGFKDGSLEKLVKLSFINGFPTNISCELQQVSGILDQSMSEILTRARVLTANKSDAVGAVAANVGVSRTVTPIEMEPRSAREISQSGGTALREEVREFNGKCFRCGGPHMIRFCRERVKTICYNCGKAGHIASRCNQQNQGNSRRVTGAPAVIPDME